MNIKEAWEKLVNRYTSTTKQISKPRKNSVRREALAQLAQQKGYFLLRIDKRAWVLRQWAEGPDHLKNKTFTNLAAVEAYLTKKEGAA